MAANTVHVVCLFALMVLVTVSFADDDHGTEAVSYDKDTFQAAIADKKHFVMFFAPWCGHCKRLGPTWDELAKLYNNDESKVTVAKVDCTVATAVCSDHEVTGYPTLKFFHQKPDDYQRYKGSRDLDALKAFVEEQINRDAEQVEEGVKELTDETFEASVKKGFHFVKFYAPWCGHCKRLAPTWDELALTFADNKDVFVSKVDCTVSNQLCADQDIKGYPTLILFRDGEKEDTYQGTREHDDLKEFVLSKVAESKQASQDSGSQQEKEEKEEDVSELTDANFEEVTSKGLTFVKFFAPWCGHCKNLAPTWEELGSAFKDKDVTIARVDCTQQTSTCNAQSIRGYPTLAIFQNGVRQEDFKGQRSLESLQEFVEGFLTRSEL